MMKEKNDFVEVNSIKFTFDDISQVVNNFYTKVAIDPYLRGPFTVVDDWPHHIDRLTHFWWIRFGGRAYMDVQYNPVQKHYETGFSEELLDHWLTLFKNVMKETLSVPQCQLWTSLVEGMGSALNRNNELMKLHYDQKK
jgi:hemoglobin